MLCINNLEIGYSYMNAKHKARDSCTGEVHKKIHLNTRRGGYAYRWQVF